MGFTPGAAHANSAGWGLRAWIVCGGLARAQCLWIVATVEEWKVAVAGANHRKKAAFYMMVFAWWKNEKDSDEKSQWRKLVQPTATCFSSAGPKNHLRNLKVLLWMVLCALPLAQGALPRAGRGVEPRLGPGRGPELMGQQPAHVTDVEEQTSEQDTHSSWGGLLAHPLQLEEEDEGHGRLGRSLSHSVAPKSSRKNRKKARGDKHCRMERKEMRVRDLGLGFDSDEIILFKYCAGTCRSSRVNYDLALKKLVDNGTIPKQDSKKVSVRPCCRPTEYETVSFMDAKTTWQTIESLSAASCSCVG